MQKLLPASRFSFPLPVTVTGQDFRQRFFPFTQYGKINHIRQGLRIEDARSPHHHKGLLVPTLRCKNGNAAQVQHVQDIGVAQLILQGKAYQVTFTKSLFGFQGGEYNIAFPHQLLHVDPGSISPFRRNAFHFIDQMI